MRKFKLVKEFPTSPPLGTVLVKKSNGWYEKEGHHSYAFQPNYVENQGEFWEEVVEKDFEILTVRGKYGAVSSFIEELDLDLKDKSIHSVKNLKNGLILTVGDTAQTIGSYPHTIQSFEIRQKYKGIRENGEWVRDGVDRVWINWTNASGGTWLEDAEKVEDKPLFTTIDGKELKHGDKFYVVDAKFFKIFEAEAEVTFKTEKWIKNSYSDKKLAEEYILLNKPVLSLEDLLSVWSTDNLYYVYKESPMFQNFKKLAESKIKGDE